jgi:hypothetical protein
VGSAIYRHTYRHREKPFSMRFSTWCDGRDACDGRFQAFSRQGVPSLLRRLSYPVNLPDEPDAQSKESRTYAILEATGGVGFV